jgi:hypothetical protein
MIIRENLKIFVGKFHLHSIMKGSIKQTIIEVGDSQNNQTNVKAYMTDWFITSKEIKFLCKWIENKIYDELCSPIIGKSKNLVHALILESCWGSVYNMGDYAQSHNHESSYSFVYYIETPKGSSPLIFDTSQEKINAEEGTVIIFPGTVWHSVPINDCNGRIVLAGNYYQEANISTRP